MAFAGYPLDDSIICSELASIKSDLQEVLRRLSDAQSGNVALAARVAELEGYRYKRKSSRDNECRWICPVCWQPFSHRESFKGHIRQLTISPTDHMHCFLSEEKLEHRILLSHPRYGDGDFKTRAAAFSSQLYDTVKSNSNSTRTSESSHSAVSCMMLFLVAVCGLSRLCICMCV